MPKHSSQRTGGGAWLPL